MDADHFSFAHPTQKTLREETFAIQKDPRKEKGVVDTNRNLQAHAHMFIEFGLSVLLVCVWTSWECFDVSLVSCLFFIAGVASVYRAFDLYIISANRARICALSTGLLSLTRLSGSATIPGSTACPNSTMRNHIPRT